MASLTTNGKIITALITMLTIDLPSPPKPSGVGRMGCISTSRPGSLPARLEDIDDMSSFLFAGAELQSAPGGAAVTGLAREDIAAITAEASSTPAAESAQPLQESTNDFASFAFVGNRLNLAAAHGGAAQPVSGSAMSAVMKHGEDVSEASPLVAAPAGLEEAFAAGIIESKKVVEAGEQDIGSWTTDVDGSWAAVPSRMLRAEAALKAAEQAPADTWKQKNAERALRLYYHAKWLAERDFAQAAEQRYREAARLARSSRRSILASHSLARLGYYLVRWRRHDEAASVLQESMRLNSSKSNPLAPYLYGVLERMAAVGDADGGQERLKLAESYILNSAEQPSEELETERNQLIDDITYWREAEASTRQCFASSDSAYLLICLLGHAVAFFFK